MSETDIQRQIMLALSTPEGRIWRNNVGHGWQGKIIHQTPTQITLAHYRNVAFGLAPGSSDLIGPQSVIVTPEMVGQRVAVFTAIEVKDKRKLTDEQARFIDVIVNLGGISGMARSVDQAVAIVESYRCSDE